MFDEECDPRIARTASLGTAADLCALAFFPRFLIPEPRRVGSLKPRTLDEIKTGEKLVPTMSDTAPTNAEIRRMTRETISQLLGLEAMLTVLQAVAWVPGTGMVAAGIAIRASLLAVRNVEGLEADCVPNRMANNTWKRLQGTPQETNQ
jgi:hypothetical protein